MTLQIQISRYIKAIETVESAEAPVSATLDRGTPPSPESAPLTRSLQTSRPEELKASQAAVQSIRHMVCPERGTLDEHDDMVGNVRELLRENLLKSMLYHMPDFEAKVNQDVKQIWMTALRSEALRKEMDDYVRDNPEILILLVRGYTKRVMVQTYGDILRYCIKHAPMQYLLLFSPLVWQFFQFVVAEEYEISADAFKTFKAILTRNEKAHKKNVAKFLKQNFDRFFASYRELLQSDQYHVKRQGLKLLSEILQERKNFSSMVKFIAQPVNLRLMIQHISVSESREKGIKTEAFHAFKFFVANPNKPQPIIDELVKNRSKLLKTLEAMSNDDTSYGQELPLLIKVIKELNA